MKDIELQLVQGKIIEKPGKGKSRHPYIWNRLYWTSRKMKTVGSYITKLLS